MSDFNFTIGKAPKDEIDFFSYGNCMWFALAIHNRYQWPLEVILDEGGWIDHAWIRLPTGETFDAAGINGAEDFLQESSVIKKVSADELVALSGGVIQEESMLRAGLLLDQIGL